MSRPVDPLAVLGRGPHRTDLPGFTRHPLSRAISTNCRRRPIRYETSIGKRRHPPEPEIVARRDELALLLSLDQGKPLHAEAYDEVDELVWLPLEHVRSHLTWDRDQELFDLVIEMPEMRALAS